MPKLQLEIVVGLCGLRNQTETGEQLINFCHYNDFFIANTQKNPKMTLLYMDITRWSTYKLKKGEELI